MQQKIRSTYQKRTTIGRFSIYFLMATIILSSSCKKFLDAKTDKRLVVPATLQDATALMDNYGQLTNFYPSFGIISGDDSYFMDTYYNTLLTSFQDNYRWEKESYNEAEWMYVYQRVLNVNIVLQLLESIQPGSNNVAEWKRLKGSALFYRSYAFYNVVLFYAVQYEKNTAAQQLGIPLRLDPDINKISVRASLQQTYDQIISDFKQAAELLPAQVAVSYRPCKASAFGALARTYLVMREYALAKTWADSCLAYNNTLIDYNTLNAAATYPFTQFNAEVIIPSILYTGYGPVNLFVDSLLYKSYTVNDLRKTIFFQAAATAGNYYFRGSYDGSSAIFSGITVDEMYLIRAEANARLGNKDTALADLNTLLIKRFKTGTFVPVTATDVNDALVKILTERRKELVYRGGRLTDLRRLNLEPQFAKTIMRKINGQTYLLPPGDARYTQYIPVSVIAFSGMQQNVR